MIGPEGAFTKKYKLGCFEEKYEDDVEIKQRGANIRDRGPILGRIWRWKGQEESP